MRFSKLLAPTVKETPGDAEVKSHQLLLRAGMIRKISAGVYTYLPLAWRVIRKIEQIVREEMDRAGGQEVGLPILQPAEIWQESGRWEVYGEEMFRLKDRHDRLFCLGPTHEEIVTVLARTELNSYKQLPLLIYQIQNKYRDERRPRFGLLRGREFIMKDLYSFDADPEGMQSSYQKMYDAYHQVFTRTGLKYRPVEADSGAIGGNVSHEFMALAETGEAEIAYCSKCDYAANVEKAEALPQALPREEPAAMEKVHTPNARTIEELARFLQINPAKTLKTLFYQADGRLLAVMVRGDREVNELKLQNRLQCRDLSLAGPELIRSAGSHPGFAGPVGLKDIPLYADREVMLVTNGVTGANEIDYHYLNVNPGRDFTPAEVWDLRQVAGQDPCPRCGEPLLTARGIEVGQVFQLGAKYSKALGAFYHDPAGNEHEFFMGCYGIGISRTLAAVVEQSHDDQGIIWPVDIAPYQAVIVVASVKESGQWQAAVELESLLTRAGLEVVLDDRDERAGVKFADADLIGYPLRITVGNKTAQGGTVDFKVRSTGEVFTVSLAEAAQKAKQILAELSAAGGNLA